MSKGKCKMIVEIRDVIHRLKNNHSNRRIERETGTDRSIVRKIKELAITNHWLDPQLTMPTDDELNKAYASNTKQKKLHPLDAFFDQLRQWREEGHTAVVIHQLLKDKCHCDPQAIRRYLNKHFPKAIEPVMVRSVIPGQDMDIDFGYLGKFLDDRGILRKAWVFSFRLRYSRRTFRKVVLDQTTDTFLMCHIHAFEWFGGVPRNIILDNCKAGVIQSTTDNDGVRRSYQELAEHYGFTISPCLPYTPEHKGGVEGDVKYSKTNFLPYFRSKEKEKNIEISKISDLEEALERWGQEIADTHIVFGVGRSPLDIFHSEEKATLKPLPNSRWELTAWSQVTVRKDWRIMYDKAYYSVPFTLIGKTVQICATASVLRIFYNYEEVAWHERAKESWEYKRKTVHAPPAHEEVLQCTREGLLCIAENAGHFIYKVVTGILSHPSLDKLRPVRKLLQLSTKFSLERLENACMRAYHYKMFSYASVKNILETNLDKQPLEQITGSKVVKIENYRFARNPEDYTFTSFEEKLMDTHPFSAHGNAMYGPFEGLLADQMIQEELSRTKDEKPPLDSAL